MEELVVSDVSNANWLALVFLACSAGVIFRSTPRLAVTAFLLTALFIPLGQQWVIFGLHFRFYRLLIIVGATRLLLRREYQDFEFTKIDRLFVGWAAVAVLCGLLRGAKAEVFGVAYDALGTYFLFRHWMRDPEDVVFQLRVLAVASVAIAGFMAVELFTHRNWFSLLGGVPESTLEREGRFRCQGPFRHPILAGTFAAALFPLMVALRLRAKHRKTAWLGMAMCVFSTYVAASSGALLTLLAALMGLALWPLRHRMSAVRWAVAGAILVLAFIMEPPVWYLISRVSELAGGTGWYRSHLIDEAVNHVAEWWLIGSNHTAHWASDIFNVLPMDPNNIDITNHYIEQGLKGGVLGLALFCAIICALFKRLGTALRGNTSGPTTAGQMWAFGVSLFAHCVAFVSVSYFDQILVFWFWLLASIPTLLAPALHQPELADDAPGADFENPLSTETRLAPEAEAVFHRAHLVARNLNTTRR